MRISGFTFVRNGDVLDYPFVSVIRSLLPLCDEIIVVDNGFAEGTREFLEARRALRVIHRDTNRGCGC